MRYVIRKLILTLLICMSQDTYADQKKCILFNTGEDITAFRNSIALECNPGDILYFRDNFGTDIRILLAATACDFSKSILMDADELACVYNGVKDSR